ncbi:putative methyltransferase-domain-containing protein [Mycena crocata]|nr:putative methyltransferase-domain-containing protein [Mycena crocata]
MAELQPPSLKLPPLRGLASISPKILLDCIDYLRVLYTPEVRGSRIRRKVPYPPSASTSRISSESTHYAEKIASLRADEFERAYTIRWLTYLINHAELFEGTDTNIEDVIAHASALLANCGGAASAGVINRVLDFPSTHGPISITLRDIPLAGDIASVGAQTWGGACVLAELISTQPAEFCLSGDRGAPLRVLELGAGTGLVGLVVAKIAEKLAADVTVVCSDFYHSVLENLASNLDVNFPPGLERRISAHSLDWSTFSVQEQNPDAPFDAAFDLILGADIVYEPEHAAWIRACVTRLLARTPGADFHLVIPLRVTHAQESSSVEAVFRGNMLGDSLTILSKETFVCDVEGNAAEEVEYAYYRIGWR